MSLTVSSLDTFKCRKTLTVGAKTYEYFSLPDAEKNGLPGISKLPFSLKVLLENLLRTEGNGAVTAADIEALAERALASMPARILALIDNVAIAVEEEPDDEEDDLLDPDDTQVGMPTLSSACVRRVGGADSR